MPYLMLFVAIAFEVLGTMLLPASQNFTKAIPTTILLTSYGLSFYFLAIVSTKAATHLKRPPCPTPDRYGRTGPSWPSEHRGVDKQENSKSDQPAQDARIYEEQVVSWHYPWAEDPDKRT